LQQLFADFAKPLPSQENKPKPPISRALPLPAPPQRAFQPNNYRSIYYNYRGSKAGKSKWILDFEV
jgi:hypothetical protein